MPLNSDALFFFSFFKGWKRGSVAMQIFFTRKIYKRASFLRCSHRGIHFSQKRKTASTDNSCWDFFPTSQSPLLHSTQGIFRQLCLLQAVLTTKSFVFLHLLSETTKDSPTRTGHQPPMPFSSAQGQPKLLERLWSTAISLCLAAGLS